MGETMLKSCPFCGGEAMLYRGNRYACCADDECAGWGAGPFTPEAWNRRASPPDAGVGVKALDLSNLLKHAFISGRESVSGSSSHHVEAWVEYDPEQLAPYKRIRAAFATSPDASLREALEGLLSIVNDSEGVAGFHLNGDIAAWGEFEEVERARAAIEGQSNAQ